MAFLLIRHLVFLYLFIVPLDGSESCPAAGGVYATCSRKVVYLIDTSTDLSSAEIQNEFDFIRYKIIPGTAWDTSQELGFCSYGTGLIQSQPLEQDRSKACGRLGVVEDTWTQLGSDPVSLYTSLQVVNLFYSTADMIVLFSASKDTADIAQAGDYAAHNMSDKIFTVIALDNANFTTFPAQVVHNIESLANPPSNLVSCLIKNACDQSPGCDINTAADPPIYYPPVSQCSCLTSTVWLDVVFLFDASKATGQNNLNNMWGFIASMLDFYTVQKSGYTGNNFYTQVGIVTYGNQATVFKPLGSIDLDDIDGIYSLPYSGDQLTNLEQGLITAKAQLDGSARRPNARQVIVAMAMTYNPSGVKAPEEEATTIKEDGVVIITYNYIPSHGGAPAQGLAGIASPGYFFITGNNGTVDDMNQALCDANCFCPMNFYNYEPDSNPSNRQLPTGGCYMAVPLVSNQRLASVRCNSNNNGTLATDQDASKSNFLANLFHGSEPFWIGLNYDTQNKRWQWPDGNLLLANDYQPWAGGKPYDGNDAVGVFVTNQTWQITDPRNAYLYICQSSPCGSTHYCD